MTRAAQLSAAIQHPKRGRVAIMPYLTCGFPDRATFSATVMALGEVADAIEIGVPFSDPVADGPVIQRASRIALEGGVTLRWILETLRDLPERPAAPLVLMSYLNPLHALGWAEAIELAEAAGISGFILPDLPHGEEEELRQAIRARGMATVQLVTPITPVERLTKVCAAASGFVYAVTFTGITGAQDLPADVSVYLDRVRALSPVPVCAGFGIRTAAHVAALAGHADGAVVGSALIDAMGRGEDAAAFVSALLD
jgi:tryptophan synthase alpha chain